MRRIVLGAAVLVALVFAASAQSEPKERTGPKGAAIADAVKATWRCQSELGVPRSKPDRKVPWGLSRHSPSYRKAVLDRWTDRAADCRQELARRSIPTTSDWTTAVALVQRVYPGTADWLLFISRREGGHGRFVMNSQGSGAGGWMQFMSSTYYAYNDRAFADLRSRGFRIDPRVNSWTHPLGQAVTAGYMRYVGLDGCHWCL